MCSKFKETGSNRQKYSKYILASTIVILGIGYGSYLYYNRLYLKENYEHTIIEQSHPTTSKSVSKNKIQNQNEQLFIQTPKSSTMVISTKGENPMKDIKTHIMDEQGIPIEHQKLLFNGQQLQNDHTLTHYKIKSLSILNLQTPSSNKATISLNIDITDILPFIPSLIPTKSIYKIECDPDITVAQILQKLNISYIIEYADPVIIYASYFKEKSMDKFKYIKSKEEREKTMLSYFDFEQDKTLIIEMSTLQQLLPKDTILRENYIKQQAFIWKNYTLRSNKWNLTQRRLITEIAEIIPTLKYNSSSMIDCLQCLLNFSKFTTNEEMRKIDMTKISESLLKVLTYPRVATEFVQDMMLQCIDNILVLSEDPIKMAQIFIRNGIYNVLKNFIDLRVNPTILWKVAAIYKWLLYYSRDVADDWEFFYDNILESLQTLLYHESYCRVSTEEKEGVKQENEIILHIKSAFFHAFNKYHTNIQRIIVIKNPSVLFSKYKSKQHQQKCLFDGFIQRSVSGYDDIVYIPYDISLIIFDYFNVYIYDKFDFIQRGIDLFECRLYDEDRKGIAFAPIDSISAYCDHEMASKLINEYNIINKLKDYLDNRDQFEQVEFLGNMYWIVSHLSLHEFDPVWKSNMLKSMIQAFHDICIKSEIYCVILIKPLSTIICTIQDPEIIKIIVEGYDFIKAICCIIELLTTVSVATFKSSMSDHDIFSDLFRLMAHFANILGVDDEDDRDKGRNLWLEKIKKCKGDELLRRICDGEFQIDAQVRVLTQHFIVQYFPG